MLMSERIPTLSDVELERLQANALRLVETGTAIQRKQAEELLPALSEALETRRVAHAAASAAARSVKRKAPTKAAATAKA